MPSSLFSPSQVAVTPVSWAARSYSGQVSGSSLQLSVMHGWPLLITLAYGCLPGGISDIYAAANPTYRPSLAGAVATSLVSEQLFKGGKHEPS